MFSSQSNPLLDLVHRPRPSAWDQFYRGPVSFLATKLYKFSQALQTDDQALANPQDASESRPHPNAISIVCISDTHNTLPTLPNGDILIHAGDLTQSGTVEEIQATLDWLKSQPHDHKIVVAGNHDLLLDQWLDRLVWVTPPGTRKRKLGISNQELRETLDWGDVVYLENTSTAVTIRFPSSSDATNDEVITTGADLITRGAHTISSTGENTNTRTLNIFGNPLSPKHGNWAFQYPRDTNIWYIDDYDCIIPEDTDILITHCPPQTHLDTGNLGCAHLLQTLWEMKRKPLLHVFGHIHAGYGVERVRWDRVQRAYEKCILGGCGGRIRGIWDLIKLGFEVSMSSVFTGFGWLLGRLFLGSGDKNKGTLLVNAAVVGGLRDDERREPIRVWI